MGISTISTTSLADSSVTNSKLATSAVGEGKLEDSNVTTAKLADTSVTTAKLADASVTAAKVASGVLTSAATQAEMEAGSSTSVYVSPGRQQYHPSAVKTWASVAVNGGNPSLQESYNVTNLTDVSAGVTRVVFYINFSTATYACAVAQTQGSLGDDALVSTRAVNYVEVSCYNTTIGNISDNTDFAIMCSGDQ